MMELILSYKTLFFDKVTTIGYARSPAMSKSLHAALVTCIYLFRMKRSLNRDYFSKEH
jgi:hypothetical protein